MALSKLWVIAWRDLGRNRRRSFLSLLAVALGLGLLILLNGYIAGVLEDSLQNGIRLETGHVQIRAASYQREKLSLLAKDLLADSDALAARASAMAEVKAAAPVLWAGGILNTADDSAGVQIYGADTASAVFAPIRDALAGGEWLAADDRGGILIGKSLANSMGVGVGQRVSLSLVNAGGQADEGIFTVRGLFSTGVGSYDNGAVFMPLAKAQAFTGAGDDASAILIMLHRQDDAERVAAALQGPGTVALTWRDLNALVLQTIQTGMSFYVLIDLIVILVVAVIIANTLLMAVFERIREMGILAALGMKGRQIMLMLVIEAAILGLAGIAVGIVLGAAGVGYLATHGIYIGDKVASTAGSIALGNTLYARFVPGTFAALSGWTLVIILLASLYPAWFAARLEPVKALHNL